MESKFSSTDINYAIIIKAGTVITKNATINVEFHRVFGDLMSIYFQCYFLLKVFGREYANFESGIMRIMQI